MVRSFNELAPGFVIEGFVQIALCAVLFAYSHCNSFRNFATHVEWYMRRSLRVPAGVQRPALRAIGASSSLPLPAAEDSVAVVARRSVQTWPIKTWLKRRGHGFHRH